MADTITFVHAADLHLDAPFKGLASTDPRIGAALAEATYEAFSAVVDTCVERSADFLVIAGDAYNSAERSLRAQLRFRAELARLTESGIQVFVAHGNHDPLSGWSAGLELPEGVHVFGAREVERVEVVRDGAVVAAVYGRSFARSAETENLARGFHRAGDEPLSIGVLHANVGGNPDHDPYAPATIDDLRTGGMDYWALGHIHKHGVLCEDPWVVYPGSTQGLNPKETESRGCVVVRAGAGGIASVEHFETSCVVWEQSAIRVPEDASIDELRLLLVAQCDRLREQAGRPVIVRIALTGRTHLREVLSRPGALRELLDDLRAQQSAVEPWVWVDRLDDLTSSPLDLDAVRSGVDFAAELVRIADEAAADVGDLAALFADIAGPLATTLPGYEPGISADEALVLARDLALDALLPDGGDGR